MSSYYIPINDANFEMSVFWSSDTEIQIKDLGFSDCLSLSFKTRVTSVTCLTATLHKVNFNNGTRDRKHDDVTLRIET